MTRTACIFQGVIALPAMLVMGGTALQSLFTLEMPIYDFMSVPSITPSSSTSVSICSCVHFNTKILIRRRLATFLGLFASGIIFLVWVQHNVETSRSATLYVEIVKSGLATAGWLWLLLDCIFGPDHYSYYDPPPRGPRIQRAAISVILLL
jgi:hypothetical protein